MARVWLALAGDALVVVNHFCNDEVQPLLSEVRIEVGVERERAQTGGLTSLAGRVARWHRVGRLQLADLLGAAKTLGEHIDECSINVVNACAQAQQLLLGCLVCIDHR